MTVSPGTTVHDAATVFLTGSGQISHIINGVGDAVSSSHGGPSTIVTYP